MSKSINKLEIMEICASFKVYFVIWVKTGAYRKGKSKVSSQRLLLVRQQEIKGF